MSQPEVASMAVNGLLPASRKDRERLIPPHYTKDGETPADAPVYLASPLTIAERRGLYRAAVGVCGLMVTVRELRDAVKEGAIAELDPEDAAGVAGAIEELDLMEQTPGGDDPERAMHLETVRAKVVRDQTRVSRLYDPLKKLLEAYLAQNDALASLTVRACLRGWENLPIPFRRKQGMVPEEAMSAIPDRDLEWLTEQCAALRELTPDQEPGSASL